MDGLDGKWIQAGPAVNELVALVGFGFVGSATSITGSFTADNKVYDGTVAATVNLDDDRVAGDNLTTSYSSASFDNKNVGISQHRLQIFRKLRKLSWHRHAYRVLERERLAGLF